MSLLDLAVYGRCCGHDMRVGYVERINDLSRFDEVWVSSLIYKQDVFETLKAIRERFSGVLRFGGKAASTLSEDELSAIKDIGVATHVGHGEVLLSGQEANISSYPPWDENDFATLDIHNSMFDMMTSRGCPYHCHFCHNTERKVSTFSHERSAANAELLMRKRGRQIIFLIDDIFALRVDHMLGVLEACDKIHLNIRKANMFFVHVNHLDEARLQAIDTMQPREMQIGIESGDDRMLAAMGKTFSAAEAEDRLRALHSRGHHVACLFLMGFPGETRESLNATVEFVRRNRPYMTGPWVSYYQPVPGTRGWEMARERLGYAVKGDRNTDIAYIDPNITEQDLRSARDGVMNR